MDAYGQDPATQPAPPAAQEAPAQPQAAPSQPQPAPRKRMSAGAKWAIGLGTAFLLLVFGSCVLSVVMLGGVGDLAMGDSIAVIRITDTIQGGGIGSGDPEYVLDQLDQAVADTRVKSILLRIDSPGGTVAASQEIMLGVRRARETKPVVTSVGDVCASGAYMVASQSDEIVVSPGSTVGSIGVIISVANIEELLSKVGVEFTTLTQGEFKDAGSMYRSLTATETAMLNEQMALIQNQFVADVASGRGMSEAEVRELATGWAWLGSEALELGLVDSIGNYNDAVDRAAELGGIEGEPYLVNYEYVNPLAGFYRSLLRVVSGAGDIDAGTLERMQLPR
ncbi:MAG TPA: signal peptide peptidase SppA [Actinobacteria bacterium]|nr:signal peptide peptidase SppA [Actinomycetota bacterium]